MQAIRRQIPLFALLLGAVLVAGCSGKTAAQATIPMPDFKQDRAWDDLNAQVNTGYRVPGTAVHRKMRLWLNDALHKAADVEVQEQPFTHRLGGRDVQMWNIAATIPGTGPAPRENVLLAAHWDTRPIADHDPNPANRKKPIAGANDGASGVAVLLEIARQLKEHPIARDVTIMFFDGEDYGPEVDNMLLGSKYYAVHLPDAKPSWGILLDMIGDKDLAIYREPNSEDHAKAVNDRVFRAARELSYLRTGDFPGFVDELNRYAITDDHTAINEAGIPMIDLIDFDYPAWHTLADTPAQCSAESLAVVGKTVLYALQIP